MTIIVSLIAGILFGFGILISGMVNPAKVQNFFDVMGTWDPSLAFVMGGALMVTLPGYHFVLKRQKPIMESTFHLPTNQKVDTTLIGGAALFGIGWGITGFCPGALFPAMGTTNEGALIFSIAMLLGMSATKFARKPTA